jgi:hypothetical protein
MASNAGRKAEQTADSASLEMLARGGLITYGVVYLLIGWLALQLAWARRQARTPTSLGR